MASPFRIFRKYQKTLLVIAGVLLMFVFVVGDSITQFIGGASSGGTTVGGGRPTDTAVTWADGKLTNRELGQLVQRREIVKSFLTRLFQAGQRAAYEAGADPQLPITVELVGGIGAAPGIEEQSVLQTRLFADAARRAGMAISDEHIGHYLDEVGRHRISREQMRNMLGHSEFPGGRVPIDDIFDALRDELMARNYIASYQFAFNSVSPQQRWQDWLRVNDLVTVEAAARPTQQFLVDVDEPAEAELAAFFEEFKEREPSPEFVDNTELPSANPGFASPRKVKVHYLRAEFDQFMNQLTDDVTDEEIETFYEQNKDRFVRADTSFADELSADEFFSDETKDEDAVSDETSNGSSDDSAAGDDASAVGDEQSAGPGAEPESADASEAEGSDTEEEEEEEEEEEYEATAVEIRGQSPDDEPVSDSEDVAADNTEADVEADTESAAETAAAEEDATDADEETATDKPVEYQPLDEVREEIRVALAQEKVSQRLPELMGRLFTELKKIQQDWEAQVFEAEDAGEEPPPPPTELTDLAPLAEEHGLVFEKTGELSPVELRDTTLGRSGNPERFGRAELWLAEYQELDVYEPALTYDLDFNHYLSVKVADIPASVPTLDEVRDEVVRAWKLREAAKLAEDWAQEQAEEAQETGLPLKEKFADDSRIEVTTTDPFSWLTFGSISPTTRQVVFRMSQPDGVIAAGPDFMRKVFELEDGQVGAVLNHDHSQAYVVRVVRHRESRDELRRAFLSESDNWIGLASFDSFHRQQSARALVQDLSEASQVDWLRPPDQPRQQE
jgi:hypothetical protein